MHPTKAMSDLNPICQIEGMRLIETQKKQVELAESVSMKSVQALLTHLKKGGRAFAFYDPCYPSPSDPGAYLSYSPAGASPGTWRMTLGNHGWSGGIYEVNELTVCAQVKNLASRGLLDRIDLDNVGFFSHYAPEDSAKNQTMNQKLASLHAGA